MAETALTWLGHATFRVDTADGKRIYVDPLLKGNPKCPEDEQTPERVDIVARHARPRRPYRRHGRPRRRARLLGRRAGRARGLARQAGRRRGQARRAEQRRHRRRPTARSSRSRTRSTRTPAPDGSYVGEACGIVLTTSDGKKLYFAGDTCVFGDMQLIGRIYQPDVAILPIGDHYTMGPREAARRRRAARASSASCRATGGRSRSLTGTPEALEKLAPSGVTIEKLQPGDTVTV